MQTILLLIQIVISLVLIVIISIQGKGGGLGSTFGSGYAAFSKRRGIEKLVFNTTIAAVVIFFFVSVANLLI